MKKKMRILKGIFGAMALCCGITLVGNNSNALTVGTSSPGKYQMEGNCAYGDRLSAPVFATKFTDTLSGMYGANIKFAYKNSYVWEQDMKPGAWANDSIDDVNFALFVGHGLKIGTYGLEHNSLHYYSINSNSQCHASGAAGERADAANLLTSEAQWGKTGTATRWVAVFSCNFLNSMDSYSLMMMQGINICMGYSTSMYINSMEGYQFAADMSNNANIVDCFFDGSEMYQSSQDFQIVAKAVCAGYSRNDRLNSYVYANSKPSPIRTGGTNYYTYTRTISTGN